MLRTDGLMLSYLIAREAAERRAGIKRVLAELGRSGQRASVVGQALIRRKLLSPKEFIRFQNLLESTRRRCKGCGRNFMAVAGQLQKQRRCVVCQRVNRIPAVTMPDPPPPESGSRPALLQGSGSRRTRPRRIGRYQIHDRIGDGGMGVIFTATDPSSGGVVALKLLRSDASDEVKLRFQREAESLARLRHSAIVRIFDVGQDGEQRYFTMEYVQGRDLHQLLPQLRRGELLELVATVAEGLHHAHEHGIIHRDVKPHNIILDADGTPKLADFGLARDLGRSSLTEMGELVGTPLYMAPEQLRGDPSLIDARTDVYALGVLLYEGLTGRLPIEARSFVELQQKLTKVIPPAPSRVGTGIPQDLDRIVMKTLEKEPRDRYDSALSFAQDLRAFLEGDSVAGRPVAAGRRAGRRISEAALSPLGLGLMSFAVVVVGVALALLQQGPIQELDRTIVEQREAQRSDYLRKAREARRTLNRARAALAEGAWETARDEAQESLGSARNLLDVSGGLLELAPAEVVQDLEQVELEAQEALAQALARGDSRARNQARGLLRELLEGPLASVDLRVQLGKLELRDGHLPAAFDQLNRALAEDPTRADARYYRAEAHRRLGRPRFALLDYEQALVGDALIGLTRAEVLASLALAHIALDELDEAQRSLDDALGLAPSDPRVRLAKASLLQARGSDQEALRELALLARTAPDDADVRLARAMAWAHAGDQERALDELALLLEHDPSAEAYTLRARLRALACQDDDAAADLAQALEHSQEGDPVRLRVRLVQARHLRTLARHGDAIAALDPLLPAPGRGEGLTGAQLPLLLERAEARIALGRTSDLQHAAADVDAALSAKPDDPRAILDRAQIWLLSDAPVQAEQALRPLLESAQAPAQARALQVVIARKQGREQESLEEQARQTQRGLAGRMPALGLEVGPPLDEATLLLERGRRLLARALTDDRHPRALARGTEQLRRAVELAPWLTSARVAYAEARAATGESLSALEGLEQALEECARTVELHALHGRLLASLERHEEALLAFQEALTLIGAQAGRPGLRSVQGRLFLLRARSAEQLGRLEDALLDLDTAIVLSPQAVEPYQLRRELRERRGDDQGALEDAERLDVLQRGYARVLREAIQSAWAASSAGDRRAGLDALEPAFEAVSPELDPSLCAQLYHARGWLRLQNDELPEGFLDLARMLELWPPAFIKLYDKLDALRSRGVPGALVVEGMLEIPHETDPEFAGGFAAFLRAELDPQGQGQPAGLEALERFLDRHPGHAAGLLMRSVLLLSGKRPGAALRSAAAALEAARPPAFGHYQLARIRASQGDVDGALTALSAALLARFDAYQLIRSDPYLSSLRDDPRAERLLTLSRGTESLAEAERLEAEADARPPESRAAGWERAAVAATAGLERLRPLLRRQDLEAGLIAARLYLSRARLVAAVGSEPDLRRDLAAALEASPGLLLDWGQLLEAATLYKDTPAARFEGLRPWEQETLPGAFARTVPVLLEVLRRGATSGEALARARTQLEQLEEQAAVAAIEPWQALLALADGDAGLALQLGARLRERAPFLAPVASWLEARVHAQAARPAQALAAIERALEGGLHGPIGRDPMFEALRTDARFKSLEAWARSNDPRDPW